ncbi:MAG TPA: hypothetical protein VLB80_01765 [Candidatus Babeliales bacterium]|nr:hypothetical protein [Candidatus Babeliales bacterium]
MINKQIISLILAATFTFSHATSEEVSTCSHYITLYKKTMQECPKEMACLGLTMITNGLAAAYVSCKLSTDQTPMQIFSIFTIASGIAILSEVFSTKNIIETVDITHTTND